MRRFIALTFLGALGVLGGHGAVSLGLHPASQAPLATLLEGCAVLVAGSAIFVTGMFGLADGYEKEASRLTELLAVKQLPQAEDDAAFVGDAERLAAANDQFWRGYARAGGGVAMSLAGLILLTAALTRTSPTLFLVGVGGGAVSLALPALTLSVRGLRRARLAHVGVNRSATALQSQPERQEVEPPLPRRRVPRYALFPKGSQSVYGRLDGRRSASGTAGRRP